MYRSCPNPFESEGPASARAAEYFRGIIKLDLLIDLISAGVYGDLRRAIFCIYEDIYTHVSNVTVCNTIYAVPNIYLIVKSEVC